MNTTMSDKASASQSQDIEDEIYLDPCPTTVFRTPYKDLLAYNGNFDFSSQVKIILQDEDTWSTIVNIDKSNQEGNTTRIKSGKKKRRQTNWELKG